MVAPLMLVADDVLGTNIGYEFSYGPLLVNKQIDAHRGTTIRIF